MISDGPNPMKWIQAKESQKGPRLELDERIQRMNCVSKPYLNPLSGWIGSAILLGHTFLGDFYAFSHFSQVRWAEIAVCRFKSTKGYMTEIAGIASRIGEQGSDVRTRSKSMGYLGLIISKEQYVKIIL